MHVCVHSMIGITMAQWFPLRNVYDILSYQSIVNLLYQFDFLSPLGRDKMTVVQTQNFYLYVPWCLFLSRIYFMAQNKFRELVEDTDIDYQTGYMYLHRHDYTALT